MKRVMAMCALGLGAFGVLGVASADPDSKAQTPPAAVPAAPPASPQTPAAPSSPAVSFPAPVQKNLFAGVDFRGKKAPDLHVEAWINKAPDTKGKVVLIDFWATWCRPCREVIPELQSLQNKFKDDLVVIGLSDQPESTVKEFVAAQKVTYAMGVDTQSLTKNAVGVGGIPHVLVIDSTGVVRWQGFPQSPEDELTEKKVQQIIEADRAQRAGASTPKKAETPAKTDAKPPVVGK